MGIVATVCPHCDNIMIGGETKCFPKPYNRLATTTRYECPICNAVFHVERQWEMIDEERKELKWE